MKNIGKELNVVYVGSNTFPIGTATTKRRRYMVDYMNEKHIECHVLITWHSGKTENINDGFYGKCDFHDIAHHFQSINWFHYYKEGKQWLNKWYNPSKKNIFLYSTILELVDYPLYSYARQLGYKIVFDQVETSYLASGTNIGFCFWLRIKLNELISKRIYKQCHGSFVISKALYKQNKDTYPQMPLCILPNSTPILQKTKKTTFPKAPVILYTGTFAPKDGIEYLIKGFLLAQKRGIKCKLIMTGKGRAKDMNILKLVEGNKDVEYKGQVSDEELNHALLESDILTMTRVNSIFSNHGFPFKLSESLATGNPVIASNVSDVTSYVTHKESAYIVKPESAEEIAEGIEYFINNPEEALRIGEMGLKVANSCFGINNIGPKFINFLKSL